MRPKWITLFAAAAIFCSVYAEEEKKPFTLTIKKVTCLVPSKTCWGNWCNRQPNDDDELMIYIDGKKVWPIKDIRIWENKEIRVLKGYHRYHSIKRNEAVEIDGLNHDFSKDVKVAIYDFDYLFGHDHLGDFYVNGTALMEGRDEHEFANFTRTQPMVAVDNWYGYRNGKYSMDYEVKYKPE